MECNNEANRTGYFACQFVSMKKFENIAYMDHKFVVVDPVRRSCLNAQPTTLTLV